MRTGTIVVLLSLLIFTAETFAARAADIVERRVVITGADAEAAARLLGIDTNSPVRLALPWDPSAGRRNCSWGKVEDGSPIPRCEDLPVPTNLIEYTPGSPATLSLAGHWHDFTTASGPRFALLSFPSPAVHRDSALLSDWRIVAGGPIADAPWSEESKMRFAKLRAGSSAPFLQVEKLALSDGSYRIVIALDLDPPELHAEKEKVHEQCKAKYGEPAGGPC